MKSPVTLQAKSVEPRSGTIYPAEHAGVVTGRHKRVLGDRFGLDQFGVNLTTLAPGAWSSQRHWHEREDEFVFVLEGEVVLVDDDGEHTLQPGDCAGFKAGCPNGHVLKNKSSQPATYIEIGTRSASESVTYSDIDMKAAKVDGRYILTRKDGSSF